MEHYYSRRERRALEKASGLKADDPETRRRKLLAGKALHNQFSQEVARQQEEAAAEKEAEILKSCMEKGMTEEEAKAFLKEQYELQRKQIEKKKRKEGK